MTDELCQLLDDYLLGELPDEARMRFERHLAECGACRFPAEQQAAIDEALKAATASIPYPFDLAVRVGEGIERVRRRRRVGIAVCCVVVAAAIALSIWSVVQLGGRSIDPLGSGTIADESNPQKKLTDPLHDADRDALVPHAPKETVQVEFPDNVLALRIESGDPDVSLFQLFPIVDVQAATP